MRLSCLLNEYVIKQFSSIYCDSAVMVYFFGPPCMCVAAAAYAVAAVSVACSIDNDRID